MNGFGIRLPVMCLIGMGLVSCSAAGEQGAASAGGSEPTLKLDAEGQIPSEGKGNAPKSGGSDGPATDDPAMMDDGSDDDDDGDGGELPGGHCDCAFELPGIHIQHGDDGISVSVELPNDGLVVIETKNGDVTTSESGVDIDGDVTIDLGADTGLPLADAKLHVGLPAVGGPTISGQANIAGSLLEGTGCGCEGSLLPVAVSLNVGAAAELLDSDALAAIRLGLKLPKVNLDSSELPAAAADVMALVEAKVDILTDGCSKLLEINAQVGAGTEVWTSLVPLIASGGLGATAKVLDGSLVSIALDGDVKLIGSALKSGTTSLLSVTLPDALVTLDREGASVSAEATVSLHPGLSLVGEALVTGEFTEQDWSLNVCGAVMTRLLGGASVGNCVDIGKDGVDPCRLPAN